MGILLGSQEILDTIDASTFCILAQVGPRDYSNILLVYKVMRINDPARAEAIGLYESPKQAWIDYLAKGRLMLFFANYFYDIP